MTITAFDLAQRFIGLKEVEGPIANPMVLGMLRLDGSWPRDDSVPWCSAFINYVAWLLRLPRSKSLMARSWLTVGRPLNLSDAQVGFDVVVFNRGGSPDPALLDAPGHVGFFAGLDELRHQVMVLGGNQGNSVSLRAYPVADLLGVRRLVA